MNVSADDFRRHFELLSDAALLTTNRDDLTAVAQSCYDEEVAHRHLNEPEVAAEEEAGAQEVSEAGRWSRLQLTWLARRQASHAGC